MIAIIVTSDDPSVESNLEKFDSQFGLPSCTTSNGCFEKVLPFGISKKNLAFSSDISFYVEQAHVVAPGAKILLVEAKSIGWQDKWDATYYVESQPEVQKVVSVSWSKPIIELGIVLKHT